MFISFEGLDGSGKSTQIKLLKSKLESAGFEPLLIREPGGTHISEEIRTLLLNNKHHNMTSVTEVLLFFASRAQLMKEVVEPALSENKVVIADRFVDSSFAYQGYGRGIDLDFLKNLSKQSTFGIMPEITFLLDIEHAVSNTRQNVRGEKDRMERMPDELWNKIRFGYLELAKQEPQRWKVLDATQQPEIIHLQIMNALKPLGI